MKTLGKIAVFLFRKLLTILLSALAGAGVAIVLFYYFFEVDPSRSGLAGLYDWFIGNLEIMAVVGSVGSIIGLLVGVGAAIIGRGEEWWT